MWNKGWICEPQFTIRLPGRASRESLATAQRLGLQLGFLQEPDEPINAGWPLKEVNLWAYVNFLQFIEESSGEFFLEAVARTRQPKEELPEAYRPDDEGYIRCETRSISTLIHWVYTISELLGLRVPPDFQNFLRQHVSGGDQWGREAAKMAQSMPAAA